MQLFKSGPNQVVTRREQKISFPLHESPDKSEHLSLECLLDHMRLEMLDLSSFSLLLWIIIDSIRKHKVKIYNQNRTGSEHILKLEIPE